MGNPTARWQRLFEHCDRHPQQALRRRFRDLVWSSIGSTEADHALAQTGDHWTIAFQRLQWALRQCRETPDEFRAEWAGRAFALWRELGEQAMTAGYESRVHRLLAAATQAGLNPPEPEASAFLGTVRRWLLDRYRLRDAARVADLGRRGRGRRLAPAPLALLGHFSAMWVALTVGAILMLDFGDAWMAMAEIADRRGILLTALLSTGGTLLYLTADLRRKCRPAPEDKAGWRALGLLLRAMGFLTLCLTYALGITAFLWFLLSGTDEVVHGDGAILHIIAWASFALFIGVFFGLIARRN